MKLIKNECIKNIIHVVAFLLILFLILRSLSYVMRTNGDSKDRFAGFYAEEKDSIDVMMFGASTVGASICAPYMWHEYGFTAYPLSSNAQRTTAIKYMIEESLRYQKPSLLVIELRTFVGDFEEMAEDEGHVREVVDNMKYSFHRIKTINAVADHFEDKWPFYIDIMKYHSNVGMFTLKGEWKKINNATEDINKGFVIHDMAELYRKESRPEYIDSSRKAIPQEQEEVLVELMDYLDELGIDVLFLVTPRVDNDDYQAMMNYTGDLIKARGFDFLDMNYCYDEMDFDFREDMYDGAHTSLWGAVKCSRLLGKYIVDNYDMNSTHSNETVEEWNNAYTYFEEQYNNTEMKEREFDE